MTQSFIIRVPVADLRTCPEELPKSYDHNPIRASQLLFNERVEILERKEDWVKISALQQLYFSPENRWCPYTGWVSSLEIIAVPNIPLPNAVVCVPQLTLFPEKITLSYGTFLTLDGMGNVLLPNQRKATCDPRSIRPIPQTFDRSLLVKEARQFLDAPYLWGGCAAPLNDVISSVDCSGLIHLIYRAQGIQIPRDAHDQFLYGKETFDPKPGDAVYLAKNERVNHVILKIEEDLWMESPETGKQVRLLRWNEEIWEKDNKIHIIDRPNPYHYFNTSLNCSCY